MGTRPKVFSSSLTQFMSSGKSVLFEFMKGRDKKLTKVLTGVKPKPKGSSKLVKFEHFSF
jgi:hypothetical protein